MSKSNYDHLKDLLKGTVIEDEAMEFLEGMQEDIKELRNRLRAKLDEFIEQSDLPQSVFLGLDTLHYRLEKGNLRIQSQLEAWVNQVKKQNCAGVEMTESLF